MFEVTLASLSTILFDNIWLAPLLAFAAGVMTAFTPCCLSSIPLVIGVMGGGVNIEPKRAFKISLIFSLGMAITLTSMGVAASLLGKLFINGGSWWYAVLGVLMILMALQTWDIINIIPSSYASSLNTKRGYFGALVAGFLGGFFSSPCSTPVLIVLLAFIAKQGNIALGIVYLLLYSIGHSILVLIAGTSMGAVTNLKNSDNYTLFSRVLKILMGLVILILAFYMFYLAF